MGDLTAAVVDALLKRRGGVSPTVAQAQNWLGRTLATAPGSREETFGAGPGAFTLTPQEAKPGPQDIAMGLLGPVTSIPKFRFTHSPIGELIKGHPGAQHTVIRELPSTDHVASYMSPSRGVADIEGAERALQALYGKGKNKAGNWYPDAGVVQVQEALMQRLQRPPTITIAGRKYTKEEIAALPEEEQQRLLKQYLRDSSSSLE